MRRVAVFLAMLMTLAACSTRSNDDATAPPTRGDSVPADAVALDADLPIDSDVELLGARGLACGGADQPCSWADADGGVFDASRDVGQAAYDRYEAGESLLDIAADLATDPRMAGLLVDDYAIVFRLDGGVATWVIADEVVDGVRSSPGRLPDAPLAPIAAYDVVGDDPEAKRALVLAPYLWQFEEDDESPQIAAMYEAARGYEGNVTLISNTTEELQVGPASFEGWGDYDVVHVSTHGLQVCEEGVACETWLAAGKVYAEGEIEDGMTLAFSQLGGSWGFNDEWFAETYPNGLPDTVVVLSGCQTSKGSELITTFGSGAVFAWTDTVLAPVARAASLELHRTLIETGATSRRAHEVVKEAGLDTSSYETTTGERQPGVTYVMGSDGRLHQVGDPLARPQPVTEGPGPTIQRLDVDEVTITATLTVSGDALRVREVAWIDNPQGAGPLVDGATLRARVAADADYLPVRLRVEGIDPGMEDNTVLNLEIDGFTARSWTVSDDGEATGRWGEWVITDEVRLPQRIEDDDEVDLHLTIDLPEGGMSEHEVDQVRLECLVGEWRLRSDEYIVELFEAAGGTAGVEVTSESGEYRVVLRSDGTYTGHRDMWTMKFATAEGTSYLTIDSEDPGTWQVADGTITVSESGSTASVSMAVEVDGRRIAVGGSTPVSSDAISGSGPYECDAHTLTSTFEGVDATFDRISP